MDIIASQITATPLFVKLFVQVYAKDNIKAPHHWPLLGESTGNRWIILTQNQMFPFDDVIMITRYVRISWIYCTSGMNKARWTRNERSCNLIPHQHPQAPPPPLFHKCVVILDQLRHTMWCCFKWNVCRDVFSHHELILATFSWASCHKNHQR